MAFDLIKFNSNTQLAMNEKVAQNVAAFNQASQGTLVLRAGSNMGDYNQGAFFSEVSGLVRRRDANAATSVSAVALAQAEIDSVKVAAGTPPVDFFPSQYTWMQLNPEMAALKLGEQLAVAQMQDMLNTAIRALVGAVSNASVTYDGSAGTASIAALNLGAVKFGDRASDLRAWIMHSKVAHDIYAAAIANSTVLFKFGDIFVREDGFGRVFIVTDSSPLFNATPTPDVYYTLGLAEGAAVIESNNDFYATMVETTGLENIKRTYQAEWTYNLGLKGYTWDRTNGGSSPSNTALGTSTNWDKVATDYKNTAGVRVTTQ